MPSLPDSVHQRLLSEFKIAADNVARADDLQGKLYYFSVFFGEVGRQLNVHWDRRLAVMHNVVQLACTTMIPSLGMLPQIASPPADRFLSEIDALSREFVDIFETSDVDSTRLLNALARLSELQFVCGGNGAYLLQKGMIEL